MNTFSVKNTAAYDPNFYVCRSCGSKNLNTWSIWCPICGARN